jgi:hypothetical protein
MGKCSNYNLNGCFSENKCSGSDSFFTDPDPYPDFMDPDPTRPTVIVKLLISTIFFIHHITDTVIDKKFSVKSKNIYR